ncbi:aminoacyl-tRNA hydrolase [Patescibacteria group bacterium]
MKIIIGLGNPGKEYQNNRHNIGFLILDKIQEKFGFPSFTFNKKFNAEISEQSGEFNFLEKIGLKKSSKVILVKPQTFMNKSGDSVQKIMNFYKATPEDILVIHDDLDLLTGRSKISEGSSAAGHNGVQDIINRLGTKNFNRLRIGVELEAGRENRKIPGQKFVLQDFSEEELIKTLDSAMEIYNSLT